MIDEKDFLERVDQLIRLKATGSPDEFAEKLEISVRKVYRLMSDLKEMGCPIVYDSCAGSYKYEIDGSFKIKFFPKDTENIDLKNIKGGFSQNILPTDKIWQWHGLDLLCDFTQNV
jgi:hypothetical protein